MQTLGCDIEWQQWGNADLGFGHGNVECLEVKQILTATLGSSGISNTRRRQKTQAVSCAEIKVL